MNDTLMMILWIILVLIALGFILGTIRATWNLFKHHSQLSAPEKRKKWFSDFWLTWFDIILNIFEFLP